MALTEDTAFVIDIPFIWTARITLKCKYNVTFKRLFSIMEFTSNQILSDGTEEKTEFLP